ncbi:MAG: hypothetical protein COB59_12500 [Rhodospirillaceae bacterium]|nr:MAG: hypothetical protein COB59_12500 [Rhodospirillaceae bacterium]
MGDLGKTISAVVIAENEAGIIKRCLDALSFCDEIVLVDGGSTDGTQDIAKACGARVIEHSSSEKGIHFNKNLGAEEAKNDWILSIDADEVVSQKLAEEIRNVAERAAVTGNECFRIPRKTYFLGKWIKHSGWWPGYVIRLWKKGHTEWPLEVHGVPQANGPMGTIQNPLDHFSYESISDWVRKADHFSGCEAEEAINRGEAIEGRRLLMGLTIYPAAAFLRKMTVGQAYKDGIHGIVVAGSAAFAAWLRAAKAWEVNETGRHHNLGGREKLDR